MIGALIFEGVKSALLGYLVAYISTPKSKGKPPKEYTDKWDEMAKAQQAGLAQPQAPVPVKKPQQSQSQPIQSQILDW